MRFAHYLTQLTLSLARLRRANARRESWDVKYRSTSLIKEYQNREDVFNCTL
jgi:hypothetical protein